MPFLDGVSDPQKKKKSFPLSKGPINAPLSQELVGEALSTKENSKHCQYADF